MQSSEVTPFNPFGVLGSETLTASALHQITGITGQVQWIACNERHSAVLTDEGLFTFGINSLGALGRTGPQGIPAKVEMKPKLIQVACGLDHTLGLSEHGELWAWGSNKLGQLGFGEQVVVTRSPKQLPLVDMKQISAGNHHNAVLDVNGKVQSARRRRSCVVRSSYTHVLALSYQRSLRGATTTRLSWASEKELAPSNRTQRS